MSRSKSVSRHDWLPTALPVIFGEEPVPTDPWPQLLKSIASFNTDITDLRGEAMQAAQKVGIANVDFLADHSRDDEPSDVDSVHQSPMRVVLMGRTMAGKSSLLTALTGSHHDRIGDGRQRFSRDVFGAATTFSNSIEVIDTPGVGAHGGTDDTEMALEAAIDADVILWVNSSDSIQAESAKALKTLGVIGKPIIVVLNCRQSLEGVGKLNLLRFPDRVFGNKGGLLSEIQRHMADAGVKPLKVVYVHALAAAEALANNDVDAELRPASRIDDLTDALFAEHEAHYENRRVLRLVDQQRQEAEKLTHALTLRAVELQAQAEHDRGRARDIHERLKRVVRTTIESMESDVRAAVGNRETWHLNQDDFGKSLDEEWATELTELEHELKKKLAYRAQILDGEIASTIEDVDAEWSNISLDQFKLENLSGFNSVWGNRLMRAGIGVGGVIATLGVASLVGGPPGFVIGTLGVALSALAVSPLKNLTSRIFLGKDQVLRKRREEVAKQVEPVLKEITRNYLSAIDARADEIYDSLEQNLSSEIKKSDEFDRVAAAWNNSAETIRSLLSELDRETVSTLLRINGRGRLARSVRRATRVPGVSIFAEFEESAFWESWLFPPSLGETLAGGKPPADGCEAASALTYTLGLVDAQANLRRTNSTSACIVIDSDIPESISQNWSDGLTLHLGKQIQIATTERSRTA